MVAFLDSWNMIVTGLHYPVSMICFHVNTYDALQFMNTVKQPRNIIAFILTNLDLQVADVQCENIPFLSSYSRCLSSEVRYPGFHLCFQSITMPSQSEKMRTAYIIGMNIMHQNGFRTHPLLDLDAPLQAAA